MLKTIFRLIGKGGIMAGIEFTDGVYCAIPTGTYPLDEHTAGSVSYKKLVLGKVTETWSKTTKSGVTFTCDGNRHVTVSKSGLANQNLTFPNGQYLIFTMNPDHTVITLQTYEPYSGVTRSSGVWHYHWFGIDGNAGTGSYPSLSDFLQAVSTSGSNIVYGYINLVSNELGGVIEWYNGAFLNGATYLTVWFGNTSFAQLTQQYIQSVSVDIVPDPYDSNDPYSDGGDSDVSVPTGDFDGTSDPIDFPALPTLGAVDSGFITLFNPDLAELQALAHYMWTNPLFDISAWKKIFADPMDAILGLSIVPVPVPEGSARPIIVGNIVTDVSMKPATAQFIEVQCGALNVNEFWSAYLDYEPYTKAEIYLPFCGVHQLSVDDIMSKTVEVRYHVDILSGACCAYVKCGDSVLYQFMGQCSSSIPISGNDFTNVINGVLSAATAIGSSVATGGAFAPLAVPALSAAALNALKPNIEKSGAMGGTGGMLAMQSPYLILTRPRQAHPANQNHYTGYPSFITENLSELSGYTEIEEIHLENVQATDSELDEIINLLKSGVIF